MFKKLNVPFIVFEVAFYGIFSALIFTLGNKEGHGNTSFIIAYVMMGVFALTNILINLFLAKKHTGENAITDFGLFYPAELVALFLSFGMAIRFHLFKPSDNRLATFLFIALAIVYVAYFVIIFFIVLNQKKNRDVIRKKVFYIRSLTSDIESCIELAEDSVLKAALEQLRDDVRFSDPMSDAQLQSLDDELEHNAGELRALVKDKKVNEANEKVADMSRLLKERNRKCKMLK